MSVANKMDPESKRMLAIFGFCVLGGSLVGIILRKTAPDLCKSYTKSCLNRKWWLFLIGLILFSAMSVISFVTNRPYHGCILGAFALLEALCFVKYGFHHLSPEMEAKIDASDPTRIFPRKKPKNVGELDGGGQPATRPESK